MCQCRLFDEPLTLALFWRSFTHLQPAFKTPSCCLGSLGALNAFCMLGGGVTLTWKRKAFFPKCDFYLKMAWGSGCAVIVQSLPLLLISCTKTEHSAISVLTHSCCVFISLFFSSSINQWEHYIDICTYMYMYDAHQLDVGFPLVHIQKYSLSMLVLHRFRFYSVLCSFYGRWSCRSGAMLPQCGLIPEEKDCCVF